MRYELKQNQGIPTPLLALMAIATGLSVANCYYNQPLLGSMARAFNVTFSQYCGDIDPDWIYGRTSVCHSTW